MMSKKSCAPSAMTVDRSHEHNHPYEDAGYLPMRHDHPDAM